MVLSFFSPSLNPYREKRLGRLAVPLPFSSCYNLGSHKLKKRLGDTLSLKCPLDKRERVIMKKEGEGFVAFAFFPLSCGFSWTRTPEVGEKGRGGGEKRKGGAPVDNHTS